MDFEVSLSGSNFASGAQALLGVTTLPTTFMSSGQVQTVAFSVPLNTALSFTVRNPDGSVSNIMQVPAASVTKANVTAAARFLDQSSWGPTVPGIARVRQIGMSAAIDEQFATTQTAIPAVPSPLPTYCSTGTACVQQSFFNNAITGPDQLRQRVGFALSKIWVISAVEIASADAFPPYLNMLNRDAFTNYLTIMKDVTLSPGMGQYLNMVNSDKPNSTANTIANENYARELLQLFTMGTQTLNLNGTPALDSQNNPTQPYTEANIQAIARAFTGWTYPLSTGATPTWPNTRAFYGANMVAIESHHDTATKTMIDGTVLPQNQTAMQDLDAVLQKIFDHPNVPPFVSRQLIQQLVTSNPSPAYVQRVATVFKDNGSGVRGDMKAIIKAILLDTEARRGDIITSAVASDGHLREPVLYEINLLRALNASTSDPNSFLSASTLPTLGQNMGQRVLYPGSVFSYFSPDYVIPTTTQRGPEFQLMTTATTLVRSNFVDSVVRNALGSGVSIDLSPYVALAGSPQQLVDMLDSVLTRGELSSTAKSAIVSTVSAIAASNPQARARTAVYLVATSSRYQVMQ
jgi:uncharacterized protein (DUF1800 family)